MSKSTVSGGVQMWTATWLRAVHKAWDDETFAAHLVENPKKALKEEFDYDFPEGLNLKVKTTGFFEGLPALSDIDMRKHFSDSSTDSKERPTLTVPLLPKPYEADTQLSWLSQHKGGLMVACVCLCW